MQTFLPYPDMTKSLKCLDDKRLGKQRVETLQIINALTKENYGWKNHPATKMWQGYIKALKLYHDISIFIWEARGHKNNMPLFLSVDGNPDDYGFSVDVPDWWGDDKFHASHRSNLLRKMPEHYSKFNWTEPDNIPYYWPV